MNTTIIIDVKSKYGCQMYNIWDCHLKLHTHEHYVQTQMHVEFQQLLTYKQENKYVKHGKYWWT